MPLDNIKFVNNPQLRINEHEITEMPFRYMIDDKRMPIMPDVGPPRAASVLLSEDKRPWLVHGRLIGASGNDRADSKGLRERD